MLKLETRLPHDLLFPFFFLLLPDHNWFDDGPLFGSQMGQIRPFFHSSPPRASPRFSSLSHHKPTITFHFQHLTLYVQISPDYIATRPQSLTNSVTKSEWNHWNQVKYGLSISSRMSTVIFDNIKCRALFGRAIMKKGARNVINAVLNESTIADTYT